MTCAPREGSEQVAADYRSGREQISQVCLPPQAERVPLFAVEGGCSYREASRRIKCPDEMKFDPRHGYDLGCLRPEYVRRMRQEMALRNIAS